MQFGQGDYGAWEIVITITVNPGDVRQTRNALIFLNDFLLLIFWSINEKVKGK